MKLPIYDMCYNNAFNLSRNNLRGLQTFGGSMAATLPYMLPTVMSATKCECDLH